MPRRRSSSQKASQEARRHRRANSSTGSYQSDDARSSNSGISSRSSVDSVLIEKFSGSDSNSDSSVRRPQSSGSEPELPPDQRPGFLNGIVRSTLLSAAKIRARKLLSQLIAAENKKDGPAVARQRRYEAATGLVKIIEDRPDGKDIVGRRFVKRSSRQDRGTRALLRLSDDQLQELGYRAISPVSEPLAFMELLEKVVRYGNQTLLFQRTIPNVLRESGYGAAGILYLAVASTRSFFRYIDHRLILDFCKYIVTTEEPLSPKYQCGAKLFCIFLMNDSRSKGQYGPLVLGLLSSICGVLIREATVALNPEISGESEKASGPRGLSLLPLIAMCCDKIRNDNYWSTLPQPAILGPFIERLIDLIHLGTGQRRVGAERGFGLWALISLLDHPSIVSVIPSTDLLKLGTVLVDMVLYPWTIGILEADAFEKTLLRDFNSRLGRRCSRTLCKLPKSAFIGALSSTLNDTVRQLKSLGPETNPYETLDIVDRLLQLSHMGPPLENWERVHRALVQGGACEFLAYVLSHTGNLDPQDRGLWRAKGLALTCLGNIVENMDEEHCRDVIKKEMIDAVVVLKENRDAPELQRGQAILFLKRHTWVADHWGIQPYYREDTSDLPEEFRRAGLSKELGDIDEGQ